jgi:hypothetical protein
MSSPGGNGFNKNATHYILKNKISISISEQIDTDLYDLKNFIFQLCNGNNNDEIFKMLKKIDRISLCIASIYK